MCLFPLWYGSGERTGQRVCQRLCKPCTSLAGAGARCCAACGLMVLEILVLCRLCLSSARGSLCFRVPLTELQRQAAGGGMFLGAGRGDLLARAGQLLDRLAGHRCQIGEPHEAVALRLLALQARTGSCRPTN